MPKFFETYLKEPNSFLLGPTSSYYCFIQYLLMYIAKTSKKPRVIFKEFLFISFFFYLFIFSLLFITSTITLYFFPFSLIILLFYLSFSTLHTRLHLFREVWKKKIIFPLLKWSGAFMIWLERKSLETK